MCIFFPLLAPSTFQTFLFSGGWGKLPVSNPAGRHHRPASVFSDSLCISNPTTLFRPASLRDRHVLSLNTNWEIHFLPNFSLLDSQQSIDFLKKFSLLLCGTTFTVLLLYFLWNFFPCPCLLICPHALSQGNSQ